ncbi:helix-turn-helix transcriptional regulator [Listeria sp. PSOL-1]|uniref:helix-turn-helix domain-containing protein n=1 Tax=Listeria sp. PSOL-1 TaxID=1844999 RepID=UPI0013D04008|nr:helix-turn-helix transcriptional regulator [Listeria sp. PSOL-1]
MAKVIFVRDEKDEFQAYDFVHDLITEHPLMATLLLQGLLQLEKAETRKLSTGRQMLPDIHLIIGKGQAYSLETKRIETSLDQPIQEMKVHFKDKNFRLIYFTSFSETETCYCFVKGYFKDKNPFTDKMGTYREEAKRIFLSQMERELSIGEDKYDFEQLKSLAWLNEGIVHYLESFSATLGQIIFAKRIKKKWTQLDLALKTDLSPLIISRVEAGDPDLSLRMYQKACQVLDIKTSFVE